MKRIDYFYKEEKLKAVELENGEKYFVVKDICRIMGILAHHATAARIDKDDKMLLLIDSSNGGEQNTLVTNVYGVQQIVFGKANKEFREQQKWFNEFIIVPNQLRSSANIFGEVISELEAKSSFIRNQLYLEIIGDVDNTIYPGWGKNKDCPDDEFIDYYGLEDETSFSKLSYQEQLRILTDQWSNITANIEVADFYTKQLNK